MSPAPLNPSTRTPPTELDNRIEKRKRDLISEIIENKKNSSRASAADAIGRAKARLSELAAIGLGKTFELEQWMAR